MNKCIKKLMLSIKKVDICIVAQTLSGVNYIRLSFRMRFSLYKVQCFTHQTIDKKSSLWYHVIKHIKENENYENGRDWMASYTQFAISYA